MKLMNSVTTSPVRDKMWVEKFACKIPYFPKATLIEKRTQPSFPLIPLFSSTPEGLDEVNKGIRVDKNGAFLHRRGLLQNKVFPRTLLWTYYQLKIINQK